MVHLTVLRKKGSATDQIKIAIKRDKIDLGDQAASTTYIEKEIDW